MGRPHFLIFKTAKTALLGKRCFQLPQASRRFAAEIQKTGILYCVLLIAEVDISKPLPLDVPISPLEVVHQATLAWVHKEYPSRLSHSLNSSVDVGNFMRHAGPEIMMRSCAQVVTSEMHDVQVAVV